MNKAEMLKLADRVEALSGPDREVDCRIAALAHPSMSGELRVVGPPTYETDRYFSGQEEIDWIGYDLLNNSPRYTASLDAAMTLVPEGWSCKIYVHTKPEAENHAEVFNLGELMTLKDGTLLRPYAAGGSPVEATQCATPALALTAAALRALAKGDE